MNSSSNQNDAVRDQERNQVRNQVREGYAAIATKGGWRADETFATANNSKPSSCGGGGCCGPVTFDPTELARAIGYSMSELASAPTESNMGLSCGNPTAIASLRPGEDVLDLGSGGGFDAFIAGPKVGPAGRVIGVDMTSEMISKARKNIDGYRLQTGYDNVEFRLGEIEHLPVADGSVDVVISNCVLNLSPDKLAVWREIARVLKPDGRVAVSDLALTKPLPAEVLKLVEALVGCVSGAVLIEETRGMAEAAGLTNIALKSKPEYIHAMTNWEDPLYRAIAEALPEGSNVSEYVTSLDLTANKPGPRNVVTWNRTGTPANESCSGPTCCGESATA